MIAENLSAGAFNVVEQPLLTFASNTRHTLREPTADHLYRQNTSPSIKFDTMATADRSATATAQAAEPAPTLHITSFFWEEKNTLVYQLDAHVPCTVGAPRHQPFGYDTHGQDYAQLSGPSKTFTSESPGFKPQKSDYMDFDDDASQAPMSSFNSVGSYTRVISLCRRSDNNFVNGTKLLNIAEMSRGKRDSILKNEKERDVVKSGSMRLKGVWIPLERAFDLACSCGILQRVYPIFDSAPQSYIVNGRRPQGNANFEDQSIDRLSSRSPSNFEKNPRKSFEAPGPPMNSMPILSQKYQSQNPMSYQFLQPRSQMVKHQLRSINDLHGVRSRFTAHNVNPPKQPEMNPSDMNYDYGYSKSNTVPYLVSHAQNNLLPQNYLNQINNSPYPRAEFLRPHQIDQKGSSMSYIGTDHRTLTPAATPSLFPYSKDGAIQSQVTPPSMLYMSGYSASRNIVPTQVPTDEEKCDNLLAQNKLFVPNYDSTTKSNILDSNMYGQYKQLQNDYMPVRDINALGRTELSRHSNHMTTLPSFIRQSPVSSWNASISNDSQCLLPGLPQVSQTQIISGPSRSSTGLGILNTAKPPYNPQPCHRVAGSIQSGGDLQYSICQREGSLNQRGSQLSEFANIGNISSQEVESTAFRSDGMTRSNSTGQQEWMSKSMERSNSSAVTSIISHPHELGSSSMTNNQPQSCLQESSFDGSAVSSYPSRCIPIHAENLDRSDPQSNFGWGKLFMPSNFGCSVVNGFTTVLNLQQTNNSAIRLKDEEIINQESKIL